jgi:anti-sigma factor RsiW
MSDCRWTSRHLAAYTDDLLAPGERDAVARHLTDCSSCRTRAAEERIGRALVRRHARQLSGEDLPPGLRSRCEAIVRQSIASGTRVPSGSWWRARAVPVLSTVVVLVFTASALISLATRRSDGLLAAQLTADHTKCFRLFAPAPGTLLEAEAIERVLAEQYGATVHLPPSSPRDGIELVGVRRCLYGEGVIPHVLYRAHGEDVSLFVLSGVARPGAELVMLGHHTQIWSRQDTTFVLVSSAEAAGRPGVTRYVMEQTR